MAVNFYPASYRAVEQLPLFDRGQVNYTQFAPVSDLQSGAAAWAKQRGLSYDAEGPMNARAVGGFGHRVFKEHQAALGREPSSDLMKSYETLRSEVGEQYQYLTSPREHGGLGVNVEVTDEDPYDGPDAMRQDFEQNRRLKVMSTATTGGHGFFTNAQNDQFRAVHDAFGHLAIGRNFSRDGEEGAYRSHAQMFTPGARMALASETRGQNSYLNWGGGDFPDNKPVELPGWATDIDLQPPAIPKPTARPQGEQLKLPL